jgi:Mib_herc2
VFPSYAHQDIRVTAVSVLTSELKVFFPTADSVFELFEALYSAKNLYQTTTIGGATMISSASVAHVAQVRSQRSSEWSESRWPQDFLDGVTILSEDGVNWFINSLLLKCADLRTMAILVPRELRAEVWASDSRSSGNMSESAGIPPLDPGKRLAVADSTVQPKPGDLVRRGPDWRYGNQDGNQVGMVIEVTSWMDEPLSGLKILWGNGSRNTYRWGVSVDEISEPKYDVCVLRHPETIGGQPAFGESPRSSIPSDVSDGREGPKMDLTYTPVEVTRAMSGTLPSLTKRDVLAYIQVCV